VQDAAVAGLQHFYGAHFRAIFKNVNKQTPRQKPEWPPKTIANDSIQDDTTIAIDCALVDQVSNY
jgi:hypothetical protein